MFEKWELRGGNMDAGMREFKPGDTITINATIEPGSKIIGVEASYKNDGYYDTASGHITFKTGKTEYDEVSGYSGSTIIPGPYLEGNVTLEYTVPSNLPQDTYRLYYMKFMNAHRGTPTTENVPESAFRIVEETLDLPSITSWEVS